MFLFHGGPSKLQAMLVPGLCCWGGRGRWREVEGGGDRSVWTQAGDRVTRSGERNMLLARVLEGGQRIICLLEGKGERMG